MDAGFSQYFDLDTDIWNLLYSVYNLKSKGQ